MVVNPRTHACPQLALELLFYLKDPLETSALQQASF